MMQYFAKFVARRARQTGSLVAVAFLCVTLVACGAPAPVPVIETTATPAANNTTSSTVAPLEPLDLDQSQPPVRLQIPEIGLDLPVTEMGWQVTMINNRRTTTWVVPEETLGWHANSAGAGAAGNMVISGRQVGDSAPMLPLAVGNIAVGQEVRVTDADGLVFIYRITEVSDPIASVGASEADQARAAAYFGPSDDAQLTLATGWPEFTTTHRIFAVGEFEGVAP